MKYKVVSRRCRSWFFIFSVRCPIFDSCFALFFL